MELLSPFYNKFLGLFISPGFISFGGLTPWCDRDASPFGFSFTTAVGVIDGIHTSASDVGAFPLPPRASGFADFNITVFHISQLPYRGSTFQYDFSQFTGGHFDQCIAAFLSHECSGSSGTPGNLPSPAHFILDMMDDGSHGILL
jgi:hypothetical protein